jgi:hypothetical protein
MGIAGSTLRCSEVTLSADVSDRVAHSNPDTDSTSQSAQNTFWYKNCNTVHGDRENSKFDVTCTVYCEVII